uniref:Uncharacterized protein n=1 Tax=viral metagenome TaxID=1070528 RepID=A0A6M3K4Q8_9ZZZZ
MNIRDMMISVIEKCNYMNGVARGAIEWMVDYMLTNKRYVEGKDGFAYYIKCDDATLDRIRRNKKYITDPEFMKKLLASDGDNVHFIGVWSNTPNSDGYKNIVEGMKKLVETEKPSTVSWYNRDLKKFILRRI